MYLSDRRMHPGMDRYAWGISNIDSWFEFPFQVLVFFGLCHYILHTYSLINCQVQLQVWQIWSERNRLSLIYETKNPCGLKRLIFSMPWSEPIQQWRVEYLRSSRLSIKPLYFHDFSIPINISYIVGKRTAPGFIRRQQIQRQIQRQSSDNTRHELYFQKAEVQGYQIWHSQLSSVAPDTLGPNYWKNRKSVKTLPLISDQCYIGWF